MKNNEKLKPLQVVRPAALLLLALLVAGCGLFSRNQDYDKVGSAPPLEVPPDLDTPDTSRAMRVPNTTYSRVADGPVSDAATAPGTGQSATPPGQGTRLIYAGDTAALVVDDAGESVYRRLGFALERIGLEVLSSDPSVNYYLVEYTDTEARSQRPGLFARWILRRKGPTDHSGVYRVVIEPAGQATAVKVTAEDGGDAPEKVIDEVLGALEERLG